MSIKSAFNLMLKLHSRQVTIARPGTAFTGTVKLAPSNYFRNLQGPEETVIHGREYIVSKVDLDAISFPVPKRGDRLTDVDLGISTITEVRELFDFGGAILGFRIRTS